MVVVEGSTIVLQEERKPYYVNYRSEYNIDMWREFKKRWMVFGVLASVALAVVCPRLGAPGGVLHMEIVRCAALCSVYYLSGRGTRLRGAGGVRDVRARLYVLSALHAHAAAPVLAAVSALALRDVNLDRRLLEGALVARSRGPCGWLSLVLWCGSSPAVPLLVGINYAISLVASPLALMFFCGQTYLPPLSSVLWTVLTTVTPFLLGCVRPHRRAHRATTRLLALLLLYIDCCTMLREAEGSLYVTDVLATLFLEVSSVSLLAASSSLYAHYGLLRSCECHALALASVPKALDLGWQMHTACMSSGLARLPSVFLAPAQALLMAALYGADDDNIDEDDAQDCDDPAASEGLPLIRN